MNEEDNPWQTEIFHPLLKGISGRSDGKSYPLGKRETIIGRHSQSDIVIHDEQVSRSHAMIIRKETRFFIQDLDSSNGVFVNNLRQKKTALKHGDVIMIGGSMLKFSCPQKWSYHKPTA